MKLRDRPTGCVRDGGCGGGRRPAAELSGNPGLPLRTDLVAKARATKVRTDVQVGPGINGGQSEVLGSSAVISEGSLSHDRFENILDDPATALLGIE